MAYEGNACGTCTACCTWMTVSDLPEGEKPKGTTCKHALNGGCSIYKDRPPTCAGWKCFWLLSQETDAPLPAELRPDKSGAILTVYADDGSCSLMVIMDYDQPSAWRQPLMSRYLLRFANDGPVVLVFEERQFQLFPDGTVIELV